MNTYCLQCKTDTENIDPKMFKKIIDYLCSQNVVFVGLKIRVCKRKSH